MGQPLVAVCRERSTHLVRRPDEKRGPAMSDAHHMAELADRWKIVQHAGCGGRRLRVHPRSVEVEDLVQPGMETSAVRRSMAMFARELMPSVKTW